MTEIEAIRERHSVRTYLDKEIEAEKVGLLQEKIVELNEKGNLHLVAFLIKLKNLFFVIRDGIVDSLSLKFVDISESFVRTVGAAFSLRVIKTLVKLKISPLL